MKRTLQDYAVFLKDGNVEEFVRYQFDILKTMDVPIMKLIKQYTEEELIQMSMKTTVSNLLDPIINGTILEDTRQRSELWESDKLEGGYSNRDIKIMDLVLIYSAQVRTMHHFLPQFTNDFEEGISLVKEINNHYTEMRKISFRTFDNIQRKVEQELNKTVHQMNEAQQLAHIGSFETNLQTDEVNWSDELYRIYGLEPEAALPKSDWIKYVIPEDRKQLEEMIRNATEKKVTYHGEYRIICEKGEHKALEMWGHILADENGNAMRRYGAVKDITERKRTEETINHTLHQLKQAQERAHIGNFEMDFKTREIVFSEELYKIYGMEVGTKIQFKELNRLNIDTEMRLANIVKAIDDKQPFEYETRITNKNGELKILNVMCEVFSDEKGNPSKIIGAAQDITHRKLAEEKVNTANIQLKEAQELSKIGSWEIDIKTGAITWSDQLYKIYGLEPGEVDLTTEDLAQFNYNVDRDIIQKIMGNAVKNKESFNFDYSIRTRNNEVKILNILGEVYLDDKGEVVKLAGTSQDITERVETITELHKAEETARAKQQFLSNMSHEIRTPMNGIIGFTKVLLKTPLNESQREYLDAIKVSGDTLLSLIDDILDLAKVESGKMTFEHIPFELETSISTMLLLYKTRIEEKKLKLVKDYDMLIPPVLIGDPMRLHQIILNLISNAIKFTSQGKITMSVTLLKEEKDSVSILFSVSDTGIGIPEDRLDMIFEKFQQATSSTSRMYGGTGLGLAIVKQLVEAQGGTIQLKSKLNEGSTFSFILTFQKGDVKDMEEKIKEEEHLELEMHNINILVAEDNEFNQLLIKKLLQDLGCKQEVVANGKEAIAKIQENHFDLILMDLHMPEMDGYEATRYIRNEIPPPKSNIPIIALTADVTNMDIQKCKDGGMNDYVAKPVDEKLLYKKIIALVNNNHN